MLQTNLSSKFSPVRDVRAVADPWGYGITFQVARIDAYQQWLGSAYQASPVGVAAQEAENRAHLLYRRELAMSSLVVPAGVPAVEPVAPRSLAQIKAEELAKAADRMGSAPDKTINLSEGVAAHVLKGWSGLLDPAGAEIPYSVETAVELLEDTSWVPAGSPWSGGKDGAPGDGLPLGAALRMFLLAKAGEAEEFRAAYVANAVESLEPASAGTPPSG